MVKEINGELCVSGVDLLAELRTSRMTTVAQWMREGLPHYYDKGIVFVPVDRAHKWFAGEEAGA